MTATRTHRSPAEWDELAMEILPELQSGSRISDFTDRIGSNADALRTALARKGFDHQGNPIEVTPVTASTPKTLAKRIAKRRQEKTPWHRLKVETGMSYGEMTSLLREFDYTNSGDANGNGHAA